MKTDILKCDGYDDCVIGHLEMPFSDQFRLVYDADKVVAKLQYELSSTYEDALEYFTYNILGAYVGEGGPLFVWIKSPLETVDDVIETLSIWS